MKVTLQKLQGPYSMQAVSSTGAQVLMDKITDQSTQGSSPMELVLMALSGCTSIDVFHILEKQKANIISYKVDTQGDRADDVPAPRPFTKITLHFIIEAENTSAEKVLRAIELSMEKYCSVGIMLKKAAEIDYTLTFNGQKIK